MLLAATIFTIFLHVSIAERSNLSRVYEYHEARILTDFRENTKLVYASCNSSLPGLGKRCVVNVINDAFETLPGERSACTVNLKLELPNGRISNDVLVYGFDSDKVLLVWIEGASNLKERIKKAIWKSTIVHISDGCRTFEAKLHEFEGQYYNVQRINVIPFDNTFELRLGFVRGHCEELDFTCSLDYYLYKFDNQGRQIGEASHWPEPLFNGNRGFIFAVPVEPRQPEKGYLVLNTNDTSVVVEHKSMETNGYKILPIRKHSCNSTLIGPHWSTVNEAIGMCEVCANSSISCWQADQKGRAHLQTHFSLDIPHVTAVMRVHNLRNGGLLLLATKCSNSKTDCFAYENNDSDKCYFMMIDTNGEVNSIELQFETKCYHSDSFLLVSLFENKQGQYCIARSRKLPKGRLEILVHCYSRDEFSECSNCL